MGKPSSLKNILISLSVFLFLAACKEPVANLDSSTLFTSIPPKYSGIDFANNVKYTEELNCYTFRNFYNGGGVGLGDFNNDGLLDIFFCGNMVSNRLYLNKGDFKFEDITDKAGVGSKGVWSSGVSIADVNGDGWLDIYVCKSGPPGGEKRYNELFINNKDLTFSEKSKEYGLHDEGLSVHAAFFDYDLDGDLDLYLLNNSLRSVGGYDLIKDQRNLPDPQGGNKLYRNEGGKFTDASAEAGIYRSNIGFGLGVAIGDLDQDGAQDMFVSNDFFERDYLYLNNQSGGFQESLEHCIRETSMGSMGADIADLNNDGRPEIFVTEMLPETDLRIKTKTKFENWDLYQQEIKNGYYHQFTRNALQLNLGSSTDGPIFAEVSRLTGVQATDWSWGALIFDMDNDGWKDIFVANGIGKDLTDQDYVNFYSDPDNVRAVLKKEGKAITKMVDAMPSEKIANYAYQNQLANLPISPFTGSPIPQFQNKATEWGLAEPSFSNGSAYGDLDNDGDLDLVVNNQDMPAFLYRNNADTLLKSNHFLNVQLVSEDNNKFAIGARVYIRQDGRTFYQEIAPMRGFESTVDTRLHFGLGEIQMIDSLEVNWPDGKISVVKNVPANQFLKIEYALSNPGVASPAMGRLSPPVFTPVPDQQSITGHYRHQENDFNDFDRDRLIFNMLSASGPPMCKGDVNGDGLEDFYIGGAKDFPGVLFIQKPDGSFVKASESLFETDKISEDTDCLFFDADGDRDMDLYVASGGNEFPSSSSALLDRLYLNDGFGRFSKSEKSPFPQFESTGTVQAADYDGDGDQDLFVGVRLRPFLYGVPCSGFLLQNDGKGNFTNVTATAAPGLKDIGMITSAAWFDMDKDGDPDLALAGEYMPITIFQNDNSRLTLSPSHPLTLSSGWWNCLTVSDLDGDGDLDLIAGNHGLNSRVKASPEKPVTMWVNDFDQNGSAEQIISMYNGDQSYPLALRNDMVMQMPYLKKKYLYFKDYANQTIEDIFVPEQLQNTVKLEAHTFQSAVFLNDGKGHFDRKPLPVEAQFAPVYAVAAQDFDKDGKIDLLLAGNFYRSKPEVGIYDGSYGWFLKGDGKGGFTAQTPSQSGFFVKGEIRAILTIKNKKENLVFVGKNNAPMDIFKW